MSFWAYILRCADGHYYTGHTDNLEYRIAQHDAGGFCEFTSRRRPVSLFWSQAFETRIEALEAERRIKPWSRAKKEALARQNWKALSYYARPPSERPSTSLGTNGDSSAATLKPLVPSVVEGPVPPYHPIRSPEPSSRDPCHHTTPSVRPEPSSRDRSRNIKAEFQTQ